MSLTGGASTFPRGGLEAGKGIFAGSETAGVSVHLRFPHLGASPMPYQQSFEHDEAAQVHQPSNLSSLGWRNEPWGSARFQRLQYRASCIRLAWYLCHRRGQGRPGRARLQIFRYIHGLREGEKRAQSDTSRAQDDLQVLACCPPCLAPAVGPAYGLYLRLMALVIVTTSSGRGQ